MLRRVKVFGRVFVRGTVAATNVAAFEAKPEVNPLSADLQTVLTTFGGWLHFLDFVQMGASLAHERFDEQRKGPASKFVARALNEYCSSHGCVIVSGFSVASNSSALK